MWSQGGSAGAKSTAPVASSSPGGVISGGHTQHSPGRSAPIWGPRGAEGKDPQGEPQHPAQLHEAPESATMLPGAQLGPPEATSSGLLRAHQPGAEIHPLHCSTAGAASHPPLRPPESSGHQGLRAEMRPGTLGAATLGLAMPPSISQKNSPAEGTEGCARRTFTQGLASAVPCVQGGGRRGCVRPAVHSLGSKERHAIPPSAPQPQVSRPRPIRGAFPAASALFLACLQCSFPRSSRLGLSAAFPPPPREQPGRRR